MFAGPLWAAYMETEIGWDDPSAGESAPGAVRRDFCMT
jgi:hypothetical protein